MARAVPLEEPVPTALPSTDEIRDTLSRNGQMRLSELREELERDDPYLAADLLELVEDGEVALLPIGEVVVIRPED